MGVVFASYNPGKLKEVGQLAERLGIELLGIAETGTNIEFEETGDTFEDNARLKLKQSLQSLPPNNSDWVAADDSGIMIDALDGEPGVKTRRWAGYEMTDREITDMILSKLDGIPHANRTASMRTVVALGQTGGSAVIFSGELNGAILGEPDKETPDIPGFPDARLFYIPDINMTYGQYVLNPSQAENFPSHRAQAFSKAFKYLASLGLDE